MHAYSDSSYLGTWTLLKDAGTGTGTGTGTETGTETRGLQVRMRSMKHVLASFFFFGNMAGQDTIVMLDSDSEYEA